MSISPLWELCGPTMLISPSWGWSGQPLCRSFVVRELVYFDHPVSEVAWPNSLQQLVVWGPIQSVHGWIARPGPRQAIKRAGNVLPRTDVGLIQLVLTLQGLVVVWVSPQTDVGSADISETTQVSERVPTAALGD